MKKLFSSLVLIAALALNAEVLAQPCNYTMSMFSQLSSGQTDSESATLAGNLTSVTFNLNFHRNGCQLPCRHDGVPLRTQW